MTLQKVNKKLIIINYKKKRKKNSFKRKKFKNMFKNRHRANKDHQKKNKHFFSLYQSTLYLEINASVD